MNLNKEFFELKQRLLKKTHDLNIESEILNELNDFEQNLASFQSQPLPNSEIIDLLISAHTKLLWVFDLDEQRFSKVHSATNSINGFSADEFKTFALFDIIMPDDLPGFEAWISEQAKKTTINSKNIQLYEFTVKQFCKNGSEIPGMLQLLLRKNTTNFHLELIGIIDISASETVENQEQANFNNLSNFIIESADDCLMFFDKKGILTYCSNSFEKLTGQKPGDLLKGLVKYRSIIHPDNHLHVINTINNSILNEQSCKLEFRIVMSNISEKYVDAILNPVYGSLGEIIGYGLSLRDITELKKNEIELLKKQYRLNRTNKELERIIELRTSDLQQKSAHLADSRTQFQNFVNYSAIWETFHDASGRIIYSSNAFEKITGYPVSDLLTEKVKIENLVHPDDLSDFAIKYSSALIGERVDDFEFRIFTKNHEIKWVSETIHQIYLDDGSRIGIRSGIKDVSFRRQLQKELFETKGYLENLFNYANVPIIVWQTDGKIIRFNPAFERLTQYTANEVIGKQIDCLFPEKTKEIALQLFQNTVHLQALNETEIPIECKNGDTKVIVWNSALVHEQTNKTITATIAQGQDISGRVEAEKRVFSAIIEAEERERSSFARELHDGLGPLLSSIKFGYEWLERPGLKTPREEIIKKIAANTDEAIRTVKEISSKLSPYVLTNFGPVFAISSYIDKISQIHDTQFHFESNTDKRFNPEIEVSLYRATLECINNAIKHAKAENVFISIIHLDESITVDISDDGIGFELAKELENPKGLGLFNMSNRIKSLGGDFKIFSEPEKGVHISFLLYL